MPAGIKPLLPWEKGPVGLRQQGWAVEVPLSRLRPVSFTCERRLHWEGVRAHPPHSEGLRPGTDGLTPQSLQVKVLQWMVM